MVLHMVVHIVRVNVGKRALPIWILALLHLVFGTSKVPVAWLSLYKCPSGSSSDRIGQKYDSGT